MRATAPSLGLQNMYCVNGSLTMGDACTCSAVSGVRRHALSFLDPFRKFLAAIWARVTGSISWSCR